MRRTVVLAATCLAIVSAGKAIAAPAQSPNFARCEALSEQRGSGQAESNQIHRQFMRDCLSGKIPPFTGGGGLGGARATAARCEDLAEQRQVPGGHRVFVERCMKGQIR